MIITTNSKNSDCESFFTVVIWMPLIFIIKFMSETEAVGAYALLEASLVYCLSITVS